MEFSFPTQEFPAQTPASGDSGTQPTLITASSENCAFCRAPMAPDQRYCLECGHRRGESRPAFAAAFGQSASTAGSTARRRVPLNSTLIAGVGTLLLAMGVGVLIGRSSDSSGGRSAGPVQVVTVAGGAAGAGAGTSTTASSAAGSSAKAKAADAAVPKGPVKLLKPKKALPPPKTVKIGSPGKGPGYQNGKFTGNFFGN